MRLERSMSDVGSSVPRRQLGRLLRQAREEAGMNLEATAEELEWSRAKMYRLEGGMTAIRTHDAVLMCKLYGASDDLTEVLIGLAKASKGRGWWHAYGDVIPGWFELYVGMEAAASRIRHYEPLLIPGLLQTSEYAAAVFETKPGRTPSEVAQKVALRMERQKLLSRRNPVAPVLEVIVDEAVLRRPIEDKDAWQRQLAHLVNVARAANVNVRVLPLATGPHRASIAGSFILLDFPAVGTRPAEPPTVYSESLTGSIYLDKPAEVKAYAEAWLSLQELALSEAASDDLIAEVIKESFDA
jgi:transcriptional regulator with XRE-family HTH domain